MIRIRVEYDAYNRTFRLLDKEFGSVLEDGTHYELFVPLMLEGLDSEENISIISSIPLAHA